MATKSKKGKKQSKVNQPEEKSYVFHGDVKTLFRAAAELSQVRGMVGADAGYYAGRGPKSCDLNHEHLEAIYEYIASVVAPEAADNFVRMVNIQEDMSASAFIVMFERFMINGFRFIPLEQPGDGNTLTGRGDGLYAQGFGLIAEALFDRSTPESRKQESLNIKGPFVMRHLDKIPVKERIQISGYFWDETRGFSPYSNY